MIYTALKGGLGNMMFEIAGMHAFAMDNGTRASYVNVDAQIEYLNNEGVYNPNLKHANEYGYIFDRLEKHHPGDFVQRFSVPFHYEPQPFVDGSFYDGFFQSEKYFSHRRQEILNLFKPSDDISSRVEMYRDVLNLPNSVAVHLRRGDYVNNQKNHALLPLEYYHAAFTHFDINSNFVFFSDDIQYCKDTFKMSNQHFIQDKDYVELYVMAGLKNCVIANSSFSWWGAWLNCNEGKKIVAPNLWFGPNIKLETKDIVPVSWIKL